MSGKYSNISGHCWSFWGASHGETAAMPSLSVHCRVQHSRHVCRCFVLAALGWILLVVPITVLAQASGSRGSVPGNVLSTATDASAEPRDPEGLDAEPYRRSPSGLLYPWPRLSAYDLSGVGGRHFGGEASVGVLGVFGKRDNAWYNEYKDLRSSGLYLNYFEFEANDSEQATYFEAIGGGLGYDDQYAATRFGRYNDWQINLQYNQIPHVYTTTYRSLWRGVGSDQLTLQGLAPGGNTDAATTQQDITTALAATAESELSVTRRQGSIHVNKPINHAWRVYGHYAQEKREGARPFGAVFGGGGGSGNAEIAESIDYDTHDIGAGVGYAHGKQQFNVETQISLFRNNIDSMRFENPLFIATNTIQGVLPQLFTGGRYDLYPDNDYYSVRGQYARTMPNLWQGRFTGVVALGKMVQDDELLAPSEYRLAGGTINGVATDNVWNTPAALSQDSAEAEINTLLLDFGLNLRPTQRLGLRGKVRYYAIDNQSDYQACNPLTGQWGRLLNDGSGGNFVIPNATPGNNSAGASPQAYDNTGCDLAATRDLDLVPSSGSVPIKSVPYDYSKLNFLLAGNYRLSRGQNIDTKLAREEYRRDHRARKKTAENSVELGYINRAFAFGNLRISGHYGRRRGSAYDLNANDDYLSAGLGPEPVAGDVHSWLRGPSGLRKFDIADRDMFSISSRLQILAGPATDAGLGVQYNNIQYPDSDFGRTDAQYLTRANLDLNYQPTSRFGLWGYYGYQQGSLQQYGVAPTFSFQGGGCVVGQEGATADNWQDYCSTVSSDNTLFPSQLAWGVESKDRAHTVGSGFFYDLGLARLEVDYTFSYTVTAIDYTYNAAGQGFDNQTLALVGDGMSDLTSQRHILNLNLLVPVNRSVAVGTLYRYEMAKIADWHYDGVEENPVPAPNAVYLDAGPQDYHVNVVGLLMQVTF